MPPAEAEFEEHEFEPDNMQDDLADALDQLEESEDEDEEDDDTEDLDDEEDEDEESDTEDDESDEEDDSGDNEDSGKDDDSDSDDDSGDSDGDDDEESSEEVGPAPVGWKAAARETWKNVPPEARAEVVRREQEVRDTLQRTTDARKFVDQFDGIASRFERHIQREGTTPIGAFEGLLQTAATLQDGTPQDKAVTIARLVGQYGVDFEALDTALANGTGQVDQAAINAAVRPYQQQIDQQNQQSQQRAQQEAKNVRAELEAFAGANEFYWDVSDQMADLMQTAGQRGDSMTLEKAYEQACKLDPEVSKVIKLRDDQEKAATRAKAAKKKKRAASSVKGRSGSAKRRRKAETNDRDDMRSDLESAVGEGDF